MTGDAGIRRIARFLRPAVAAKAAGLVFVFVATAAPLPGDGPGCFDDGSSFIDESPVINDEGLRYGCIDRCQTDCLELQACGIWRTGPDELQLCKAECSTDRECAALTVARLCPEEDAVVTSNERDACVDALRPADPPCGWCPEPRADPPQCWPERFPGTGDPPDCQRAALCDPRE